MNSIPGDDEGNVGAVTDVGEATEVEHVKIKVNGITIEVTEEIKIRDVLIKAKGAGAIEGVVEEYVLERVEKAGELGIEETVMVTESEEFVAVPTGRTDVA